MTSSDSDIDDLPQDDTLAEESLAETASDADSTDEDSTDEQDQKLTLDVTIDEPSACERHITVTVARPDIERYLDDAFGELVPKAEVPGFRIGRAPRKLVETRFKKEIGDQVKGSILMDAMTQISADYDFSAISEPDFDFDSIAMPDDGDLTFEFNVEVRPEFEMPEWKNLNLDRQQHEYSADEVEERAGELLQQYGTVEAHDGQIEATDLVTLNMTFSSDNKTLSTIENHTCQVQPNCVLRDGEIKDFDKFLTKCKKGDKKKTAATMSNNAENEPLRGQTVDVEIEVLEVQRTKLPQLTEDFLDELGGFSSTEDLHAVVREELERQLGYHQQQHLRKQITGLLTEAASWELPPALLKRQSNREMQRMILELQASGFSDNDIRNHANRLQHDLMGRTETALKEHFILEKIAEDHSLEASAEDISKEIGLIAAQRNESPRRVRAQLEKRGEMDALQNQIVERKAIDLITGHATITDVPLEDTPQDKNHAIDHAISGESKVSIPDAKHSEAAEAIEEPTDYT
ncbi:MAG: trigger factor [Pirellulaceae bacterium]